MNGRNSNKKKNKNNKRRNQRGGYSLASANSYTSRQKSFLTGIDPHMYVALRYVQNFGFAVLASAAAQQTMNINSLFDPDRTGVGHQPYLFDTLQTIYNRYRVLNVNYKVTFHSITGTYNGLVLPLNGLLNAAITNQTTFETACEQPRARVITIPGGGGRPTVVSKRIQLNALNGCTRVEYLADDRFEAQIGASPTEVMTLTIGMFNPTPSPLNFNITVEMNFESDLHDLISLPGS